MRQPTVAREAWALPGGWDTAGTWVHFAFDRFLLLPLGAAIAIVWANTAGESYFTLAHRLAFPVNAIGMALFFGLLAQELVDATMPGGTLHTWRRWSTAIVGAAGGMAGAAGVYLAFVRLSYEEALVPAWPVAIAVDAAAAYYVLRLLLPRSGVLPFALLLAIATNIAGVILIAFANATAGPTTVGIALFVAALAVAAALRAQQVRSIWPYLLLAGPLSWLAFYVQGVHPAFALVPIVPFLPHQPRRRNEVFADPRPDSAIRRDEHEWNLLVQVVLFFFGLVNAGVLLRHYDTGTWAILAAALVGRPGGILLGVWLAVVAGLHLPKGVGWREMIVLALATSSGFTFALFFATSVLAMGPTLSQIKIGAFTTVVGALLAIGAARLLRVTEPRRRHA